MSEASEIPTVTYFLVLLRPGPRHTDWPRFEDGHVAHIDAMAERGVVLLGGEFVGGLDGIEAAYLLHTRTRDEAAVWAERDPLVRERVVTYEIVAWELVGIEPTAIDPAFADPKWGQSGR